MPYPDNFNAEAYDEIHGGGPVWTGPSERSNVYVCIPLLTDDGWELIPDIGAYVDVSIDTEDDGTCPKAEIVEVRIEAVKRSRIPPKVVDGTLVHGRTVFGSKTVSLGPDDTGHELVLWNAVVSWAETEEGQEALLGDAK